ncbi:MAG: DUF3631 domain-containing protein [Pseudomonadota bacterium]
MTEQLFKTAMTKAGLETKDPVLADGKLHRFHVKGDNQQSQNGWYVLYGDGLPAGSFGSWKTGESFNWCSKERDTLSPAEQESMRQRIEESKMQREAEDKRIKAAAREKAQRIWKDAAVSEGEHPYLKAKNIKAYGVKQAANNLIIPMQDAEGEIHSLQFISPDGLKRFLKGGRKKGCFSLIGSPGEVLAICEGYATGASIHAATGFATAVSFDAGNLLPVAKALTDKFPKAKLIICADNDAATAGNPGLTKALQAAKAVNADMIHPHETGICDFNDLAQAQGLSAVKASFKNILSQTAKPEKKSKLQGSELVFDDPEPWDTAIEGEYLFSTLVETLNRYCVLETGTPEALALWCVFSYVIDEFTHNPRLLITSPEKGCGKTTVLSVISQLVNKPLPSSNMTPASVFRVIEAYNPTLLIDEGDTFLAGKDELRGILNSGHNRAGAFVIRVVGDNHEIRQFSTWTPMVIAMIGMPADTLASRSVTVSMRKKMEDDRIERLTRQTEQEFTALRRMIVRWALDNTNDLREYEHGIKGIPDRMSDNWRPLLTIANHMGKPCLDAAVNAMLNIAAQLADDDDQKSVGVMLLEDIKGIFDNGNADRIHTNDLVIALLNLDERPWATWRHGKPLTGNTIAKYLKPYGIQSRQMKIHGLGKKGYQKADFVDTWARYLSQNETPKPFNEINQLGQLQNETKREKVSF